MNWNKFNNWLRFGIIAALIDFVFLILLFMPIFKNLDFGWWLHIYVTFPLLSLYPFNSALLDPQSPFLPTILGAFVSIALWFLIGTIIGLMITKIKSITKNKKSRKSK